MPPTQLALALDVPDRTRALELLDKVGPELEWVKIGLQLFTRYGPSLVEEVAARNLRIFLDLKLHDIPNTVASAIRSLSHLPVDLITLHCLGGSEMMSAAREACHGAEDRLRLIGVTILTSHDENSLRSLGLAGSTGQTVMRLARLGLEAGLDGLVCAPGEAAELRKQFGQTPWLVTPGIRPSGSQAHEQKRAATPAEAVRSGSSLLVVGRPVLEAPDPVIILKAILAEMASAQVSSV